MYSNTVMTFYSHIRMVCPLYFFSKWEEHQHIYKHIAKLIDVLLKVNLYDSCVLEPQSFDLVIDGKNDLCSKGEDINFQFTGFGVVGKVSDYSIYAYCET